MKKLTKIEKDFVDAVDKVYGPNHIDGNSGDWLDARDDMMFAAQTCVAAYPRKYLNYSIKSLYNLLTNKDLTELINNFQP